MFLFVYNHRKNFIISTIYNFTYNVNNLKSRYQKWFLNVYFYLNFLISMINIFNYVGFLEFLSEGDLV